MQKNKLITSIIFSKHINANDLLVGDEELSIGDEFKVQCHHDQDCCESHYLDFEHFPINEIKEMGTITRIDITGVDDMGINLRFFNKKGLEKCVFIAGRGYNNGYYSDNLNLIIKNNGRTGEYDISNYQNIND